MQFIKDLERVLLKFVSDTKIKRKKEKEEINVDWTDSENDEEGVENEKEV